MLAISHLDITSRSRAHQGESSHGDTLHDVSLPCVYTSDYDLQDFKIRFLDHGCRSTRIRPG